MSIHIPSDLYAGMQGTFSKVITEGEAALFAGLVGDDRLKIQTPAAEEQPGRMPVQHLLLVGIIGGFLNNRITGADSQCITVQFEFLAPVFCGDRIDTTIELTEFDPNKRLATFKTDCYNQHKNQVITGQAVMLVSA